MGPLEILRVIFGFILVLFVPGFALSWALFPAREDLSDIERLAYTFVLSLLSVILGVLFWDVKMGLPVTTENILIVIGMIVAFSAVIYAIQVFLIKGGLLRKWWQKFASTKVFSSLQQIVQKFISRIQDIRSSHKSEKKKEKN